MSTVGNTMILIDHSGNNNHVKMTGISSIDPSWYIGNRALTFEAGKFVKIPEFPQYTGEVLIDFWLLTPSIP